MLFIFNFFIEIFPLHNHNKVTNHFNLGEKLVLEPTILYNFSEIGDWGVFYIKDLIRNLEDITFDNTSYDYMQCRYDFDNYDLMESIIVWEIENPISTTNLSSLKINLWQQWEPEHSYSEFNHSLIIEYTDGTSQLYQLLYENNSEVEYGGVMSQSFSFTNISKNKFIEKIVIYRFTDLYNPPQPCYWDIHYLTLEIWGFLPEGGAISIPANYGEIGQDIMFVGEVTNGVEAENVILFIKNFEFEITKVYNMSRDDFSPYFFRFSMIFNSTGDYFFKVRFISSSMNYTESDLELIRIVGEGESFPKVCNINYWTPYSTFAIPSTLKQYVAAEDELFRICDFSEYEDRGTNLTWRPYSGLGTLNYSVANQRLYLNVTGNGVEADLEETINIDVYDSITFQLKVKNTTEFPSEDDKAFYVVMNPSAWTADYRINLINYFAYNNTWLTLVIPFELFTFQYDSDALAEIGFYSPTSAGNLDCEIREIHAADYLNFTTYLNSTNATTNQIYLTSQELNLDSFNDTNIVLNSSINRINYSTVIDSGFNNSLASWENVSITNNASISTNNTGHYKATDSFFSETNGNTPSQFTINEKYATVRVEPEKSGRKKIIHFDDTDAISGHYASITNSSGLVNLAVGKFEFAEYIASGTNNHEFRLIDSSWTHMLYYYTSGAYYHIYDGTHKDLYYQNGTLAATKFDQWVLHKFEFNTSANSWNWSISADGGNTYELLYEDAGGTDNDLQFNGGGFNGNFTVMYYAASYQSVAQIWLDSIDVSSASGYYESRISNVLDTSAYYISDVIDFNQIYDISNITINSTIPANTTLSVFISDNSTGSF
ncbi:MAG: hypothetical protein ACTSYF_01055, partial [Promethearchaeota archaeon]